MFLLFQLDVAFCSRSFTKLLCATPVYPLMASMFQPRGTSLSARKRYLKFWQLKGGFSLLEYLQGKDIIVKSLLWVSEAEKFRIIFIMIISSYSHLSWKFHFQRNSERMAMLIYSKKYWCKNSNRHAQLHCLQSEAEWGLSPFADKQK